LSPKNPWRVCSACKKPIGFGEKYWVCSVSTCNRKRNSLVFCSVPCWEVHLPDAHHREAWAVEETAPRETAAAAESPAGAARPTRPAPTATSPPSVRASAPPRSPAAAAENPPREVLIVASRLKDYVRARSGFNTSERVLEPLSDIVRRIADEAIANAARDGRKTVLDRDVPGA
jgi:hypothetical protein